jgi:8-oxo-dGTP pyrophosphatase MutT (NUDIX family)
MKIDARENEPESIVAGGGVVFRKSKDLTEVLMIHRRGVWDLPKGKLDPGETAEQGALREVCEETGCGDLSIRFPLGVTEHIYVENGTKIRKKTWWFAMESGRPELKPQKSEQIDELEWVDISKARDKAHFENLRNVLSRFADEVSGV